MEITFDQNKNKLNLEKHGISLADAQLLEWETLWATKDLRDNYQEIRFIGYAYLGLRLMNVIYTDRGSTRRVISLRKANKREVKKYANA